MAVGLITPNNKMRLYEIDIHTEDASDGSYRKGEPFVSSAATIDLSLLPNQGLQRIPMLWFGIEISTFEILILDGASSLGFTPLDPLLCNMDDKSCDYAPDERFSEIQGLISEFDSYTKSLPIKNLQGQVHHVFIWGRDKLVVYDWNILDHEIHTIARSSSFANLDTLNAVQVGPIDWLLNGKCFPPDIIVLKLPLKRLQSLNKPFSPLGKSVDNPTTYDVETQTFTVSSSTPIQFERMGVNTIPQKLFDCPASASLALPAGNLTAKIEEGDDDRTNINRLPKPQTLVVAR